MTTFQEIVADVSSLFFSCCPRLLFLENHLLNPYVQSLWVIYESRATVEHLEIHHACICINNNEFQSMIKVSVRPPNGTRSCWPSGCHQFLAFYHSLIIESLFSSLYDKNVLYRIMKYILASRLHFPVFSSCSEFQMFICLFSFLCMKFPCMA